MNAAPYPRPTPHRPPSLRPLRPHRLLPSALRWAGPISVTALLLVACGEPPADNAAAGEAKAAAKADDPVIRIPVEVDAVERRAFSRGITLAGTVEASRTAAVSAELGGRLLSLDADEGDHVEAGKTLARIDGGSIRVQLAQAEANVKLADAQLGLASTQLKRTRRLVKGKVLDESKLDQALYGERQARAAKRVAEAGADVVRDQLRKAKLHAPISGTVVRRAAEPGELVSPGMPLLQIADFDTVKVVLDVPEQHIARVRVGSEVRLQVGALAGLTDTNRRLVGAVSHVPMMAHGGSRTYPVEVSIPNPDGALRGGMLARASLTLETLEDVVVVPLDALVDEPGQGTRPPATVVFVVDGAGSEGIAKRVPVQTGASQGDEVVVTAGLQGGERLIVVGQRRVVDGDLVEVVTPALPEASTRAAAAQ